MPIVSSIIPILNNFGGLDLSTGHKLVGRTVLFIMKTDEAHFRDKTRWALGTIRRESEDAVRVYIETASGDIVECGDVYRVILQPE